MIETLTGEAPRLGFCCKFIPDPPAVPFKTKKAEREALLAMNVTTATLAYLQRLGPAAATDKLIEIVGHNLDALARQIAWVAARPPLERLLRMASSLLPGYTHPFAVPLYAEPVLRDLVATRLAEVGALARSGGVRLSFHPGPFCLIATRSETALANGLDELHYHADLFGMMGYGGGWLPHGAHVNIHVGAGDPGVEGFRRNFALVSQAARDLLTIENDENLFGLDEVLKLSDLVPIVLDLHHHWVASGGEYIEPDDPRIARVLASWRGVRPIAHVSVSREALLPSHDADALPDFAALREAGHSWRDLAAHSDLMWNRAVNDLVGRHLAWADFEIEAKAKNLASTGIAAHLTEVAAPRRSPAEALSRAS